MRKFVVVKDNRIVNFFVTQDSAAIKLNDGEELIDVTTHSRKYKRKERYKKLLWLFK